VLALGEEWRVGVRSTRTSTRFTKKSDAVKPNVTWYESFSEDMTKPICAAAAAASEHNDCMV